VIDSQIGLIEGQIGSRDSSGQSTAPYLTLWTSHSTLFELLASILLELCSAALSSGYGLAAWPKADGLITISPIAAYLVPRWLLGLIAQAISLWPDYE